MLQASPFQCSISVLPPTALPAPISSPTARTLLGPRAVTALIVAVADPGWLMATTDHVLPLKCSASGAEARVVVLRVLPTSQMSLGESAESASPDAGVNAGSGNVTTLHPVPLKCSSSPPP